ncbi:MAG: transporter [Pseudomonas sp.]|nr:transporter [Pseudomonas sp.]
MLELIIRPLPVGVRWRSCPSLRWNLFDHGQISNNVRIQDAHLQQLIETYRDTVRQAAREADDAASGLTRSLERERILGEAQTAAKRSLPLASAQYREGYSDFQRVLEAQSALLQQQDNYLISRGNAVSNLIALYKALGGGWPSASALDCRSPFLRRFLPCCLPRSTVRCRSR